MRAVAFLLATTVLLAACGTKGPLTMPPKPSQTAQPPAPSSAPTAPKDASTGVAR